jgi:plastocyanin
MATDRLGRLPTITLAVAVPLVALVTVVITLTASSDSSGTAAAARGGTAGDTITIKDFRFSPSPLVVDVGSRITVANDDRTAHTVTAKNGAFDTGDVGGGATATVMVAKPGTYHYFCNIHNYMTGTIEAR